MNAYEAAWEAALLHLTPSVGAFVLGFYVIGNIWTAHHEVFRLVRRFDARLLAPNMLLLFAVVLIPNATALMGSTTHAPAPYVVYSAVMVMADLSKAWLTSRALRPALVGPGASRAEITALTRRSWLIPAASAVALALAFVVPAWNNEGDDPDRGRPPSMVQGEILIAVRRHSRPRPRAGEPWPDGGPWRRAMS